MQRAPEHTYNLLTIDGRYVGADNLRFASILSIITLHSAGVLAGGVQRNPALAVFHFAIASMLKFGTIGFFLISGFLLERNLRTRNPLHLFQARLRKIFLPWTFWFVLTCLAEAIRGVVRHEGAADTTKPLQTLLADIVVGNFTTTAFWFVPNLLFALAVLLLFRTYLQSIFFGALLLALSLFYSANIYTQWLEVRHSQAYLGFIFYLWLGHYAGAHVDRFGKFLRRISTRNLWLATTGACLATLAEGRLLVHLHSVDSLNTLKITTQAFSVLVFLCFFKYQRRIWPKVLDVSRTTFGMYLCHVIILVVLTAPLRILMKHPSLRPFLDGFATAMVMWLVTTALAIGVSFTIARALARSPRLRWTVGSPRSAPGTRHSVAESTESVMAV